MENKNYYDIAIVGGGIVGSALLYTLSRYTDLKRIALIERSSLIGSLNSSSKTNAQTLHFGDIETNYTEEKATQTQKGAERILKYAKNVRLPDNTIKKCQKLLFAVGDEEIKYMDAWYESFAGRLFGGLKRIEGRQISKLEPNLMKGRDISEKVSAYLSDKGYMVDFGRLARSFVSNSRNSKKIDILLNTTANSIQEKEDEYLLETSSSVISCRSVVFSADTRSLDFAKSLGIAEDLTILPTGGAVFISKKILNGKVYRVQKGTMNFAAVHGDIDINNPSITRFSPVIYLPVDIEGIKSIPMSMKIFAKYHLLKLVFRHISYGIPLLGKELLLRGEIAKITPSLKYSDISLAKGYGGICPWIANIKKGTLSFGEEKLKKDGAIFNISPSPGASNSLVIAESDARYISEYLDCKFYEDEFNRELG